MIAPNPYTLPTIDFVGGATQELVFHTYFYIGKKPFDLSACTANFSMINYVNKNGAPLISKEMQISEPERVSEDEEIVSNILRVTLDPEDTVELVGKFIYQITIRDVSGDVEIPNQGIIRIVNNINKAYAQ